MKEKTWKILDYGAVPTDASTQDVCCTGCYREAKLPMVGFPIAQVGQGIVFDTGLHALPTKIQCRQCRRIFELA